MDKTRQRDPPRPPEPPPFQRRLQIGWLQLGGVSLLALLPLAALTGVLGEQEARASARAGELELSASYPRQMLYKGSDSIELQLSNHGERPLERVTVRFAEGYLAGFADLRFRPPAERLTGQGTEVELGTLEPGQTRRLVVELRADAQGRHGGRISAFAAASASAEVQLSTRVLP